MWLLRPTAVLAVACALALAGCGEDGEEDSNGTEAASATDIVAADGVLSQELGGEVEGICARLGGEIGSLPAPDEGDSSAEEYAGSVDELQDEALADLRELSDQVPDGERPAWDAYLDAQETAFELSPPPTVGEPQPQLDAASAAAESQAAELGFASCSSV
jgi:hypothetical protein